MAETAAPRPGWTVPASCALAVAGLGSSGYLTWTHFTDPATLSCPSTGVVDCVKVTTSAWAEIAGVPVAVLGLVFFVAMLALCVPRAWRSDRPYLAHGRLVLAVAGVIGVVYLVAAELLAVRAVCLWCTAVHVVAFGLFVVVLADYVRVREPLPARP